MLATLGIFPRVLPCSLRCPALLQGHRTNIQVPVRGTTLRSRPQAAGHPRTPLLTVPNVTDKKFLLTNLPYYFEARPVCFQSSAEAVRCFFPVPRTNPAHPALQRVRPSLPRQTQPEPQTAHCSPSASPIPRRDFVPVGSSGCISTHHRLWGNTVLCWFWLFFFLSLSSAGVKSIGRPDALL